MAFEARRVLPTKINLMRLRRERASIRRIRNILIEKRNALLLFIRIYLEEYDKIYLETYRKIKESERLFGILAREMGYDRYKDFTSAFEATVKVSSTTTTVFTIKAPIFTVDESTYPPIPTYAGLPLIVLDAISVWRDAFKRYMRVIEIEQILRKLIEELKETQRLINAIENVILPSIERSINYIKMILDERAREEFVRMKFIKRRIELLKESYI